MIPGLIFIILILSFVLIKAADMVIVALRRISRETHTGVFALSAVILALGTSLPELFVGITSALERTSNLSLGVVIGSNIANIALIGGVAGVFAGRVSINKDYLRQDVATAFLAGILPLFLILDRSLGKVDGLILISVYLAYALGFFKQRFEQIGRQHQEESFIYRFMRKFNQIESVRPKEFGRLFLGIALLLFTSDAIVKLSVNLASSFGVPIFVIGLIILAVGTSFPELVFSFRSLEDHEPSMFFGNLLGSVIANSTLIIGITALINPIRIEGIHEYYVASITFILVFLTFWLFIRSKHQLARWEAAILLVLYFIFAVVEFV